MAENGDVVMVMERRTLDDGREGQFVLRVRNWTRTLLHGTRAVGVSQTLRHGASNGITELSHVWATNEGHSVVFVTVQN